MDDQPRGPAPPAPEPRPHCLSEKMPTRQGTTISWSFSPFIGSEATPKAFFIVRKSAETLTLIKLRVDRRPYLLRPRRPELSSWDRDLQTLDTIRPSGSLSSSDISTPMRRTRAVLRPRHHRRRSRKRWCFVTRPRRASRNSSGDAFTRPIGEALSVAFSQGGKSVLTASDGMLPAAVKSEK